MAKFSRSFVRSKLPRKQRKYLLFAPIHIRRKLMRAKVSEELSKKYNIKRITVRKGDKVKVMRGKFRGVIGTVEKVDLKNYRIYIDNVFLTKKDGSKVKYPIHPSKVMIVDLNLSDKRRVGK